MSLASNCAPQYPCADSFQAYCLYDNEHVGDYLQLPGTTSLEDSCHNGHRWAMFEDSGFLDSLLDHQACHLPALTEPCNSSSSRIFSFGNLYSQPEDLQSILQCKASSECSSSNPLMLSFEQEQPNSLLKFSYGKNSAVWNGNLSSDHQLHQANRTCSTNPFQPQEMNCLETGNAHGAVISILKENKIEEEMDWLYSEEMPAGDALQQRRGPGGGSYKRPYVVVDVPSPKRLCDSGPRNSETKPATSSKDPQSIAAKNRRKRISERLKILQDLVPNGTKLDSVTMLEKAISYVKFLQLQVKVLTADELWPTQGGKATDAAQMKEAIDAILSLQRIEPLAQSYQSNKP